MKKGFLFECMMLVMAVMVWGSQETEAITKSAFSKFNLIAIFFGIIIGVGVVFVMRKYIVKKDGEINDKVRLAILVVVFLIIIFLVLLGRKSGLEWLTIVLSLVVGGVVGVIVGYINKRRA